MPRYEFECILCNGLTEIYLHDGDKLKWTAVRCEHCKEKKGIQLILFVRDASHMIKIIQEQLEKMSKRIEELENGEEPSQDYEIKN